MLKSYAELGQVITAQLTCEERDGGVAYVSSTQLDAGTDLVVGQEAINVPWDSYLAFVDRQPMANWGHSCRYVLINRDTSETRSIEARFPPFHRGDNKHWRIAYRAPGVPDAALLAPEYVDH